MKLKAKTDVDGPATSGYAKPEKAKGDDGRFWIKQKYNMLPGNAWQASMPFQAR